MKREQVFQLLSENPNLSSVPKAQLDWLIEHSAISILGPGEFLFKRDEPADNMIIILKGRVKVYLPQGKSQKEMGILEKDEISGLLPFSRLEKAIGFAEVIEDTVVLLTHRNQMKALVSHNYELTETLVRSMTTRVREFTSFQQQNEKMLALGKLSAGLAHELNNPASAIVRSSDALKKHLYQTPDRFKKVITMAVTTDQVDKVNEILFEGMNQSSVQKLSLRQRNQLEEDLSDWFEDESFEDYEELAENLVDYGFGVDEMEKIKGILEGRQLEPVLMWINNVLTTERMVGDIHESSKRISELVQSIKSYSHMDRTQEKTSVDIHTGIIDTLNILVHKLKSSKVTVDKCFEESVPEVMIHPGEMNQVWTNILDNAIDALDGVTDPMITIRTKNDRECVFVEFEDNGPGIPDDVIKRIFDPFFTTKEIGKGSGMGLDITKRIIERHDGTLDVESVPGKTVFTIKIPVKG
jgi:signal transduction histidine kinase